MVAGLVDVTRKHNAVISTRHDADDLVDICYEDNNSTSISADDDGHYANEEEEDVLLSALKMFGANRRHRVELEEENDYDNVVHAGCSYSYIPPTEIDNIEVSFSHDKKGKDIALDTSTGTATTVPLDESLMSMESSACHTGTTNNMQIESRTSGADVCEVSRLTVNTHTSILNITEEDEDDTDDDEPCMIDETNFLFRNSPEDNADLCPLSPNLNYSEREGAQKQQQQQQQQQHQEMKDDTSFLRSSSFERRVTPPIFQDAEEYSIDNAGDIPETPPTYSKRCFEMSTLRSSPSNDLSFVDKMMDQFVEGLCTSNKAGACNVTSTPEKSVHGRSSTSCTDLWEGYRRLLEYDILILLGCIDPPEQDEIENVWAWQSYYHYSQKTSIFCYNPNPAAGQHGIEMSSQQEERSTPVGPQRLSWKQRCAKVHRIRQERNLPPVETGLILLSPGPSSFQSFAPRSSRSFEGIFPSRTKANFFLSRHSTTDYHFNDWDGSNDDEIGYDTDPEVSFLQSPSVPFPGVVSCASGGGGRKKPDIPTSFTPMPPSPDRKKFLRKRRISKQQKLQDDIFCNELIVQQVQESLNLTWTLSWSPGTAMTPTLMTEQANLSKDNTNDYQPVKSVVSKVWIERGTLVRNNSVMIEPSLKWRQAYYRHSTSLPHQEATKPFTIPLLKICRILPGETCSLKQPCDGRIMRFNHCIVVRCSNDCEEHVFEAPTIEIRDDTLRRWKMAVARFAALAVLEDADSILNEFFITTTVPSIPSPVKQFN